MKIELINASKWRMAQDGDTIKYSSGYSVLRHTLCAKIYAPFAFVHFDTQTQKVVMARDHFGQEPLYYSYQHPFFIFGSTIPDILRYLPHSKTNQNLVRDCFLRIPADDPVDDPPYCTETYYQGIFRVTPGCCLFLDRWTTREECYWSLNPNQPELLCRDEREYAEHFSVLLDEAIHITTSNTKSLAAEFSGGLDSTALFVACRKGQLSPSLFTHVPPKIRQPTAEDLNVKAIISQFSWAEKHHSVDANDFEPMPVLRYFAMQFGGPPPNMNGVLSNNLHQAVIAQGHDGLLSGFGGDDCVSLIVPHHLMDNPSAIRQYEYDILQGTLSHEMRMRLEYNAVIAKAMNFTYIYPMLYPPLVEFCFSLPLAQKFKQGHMRCMIRGYLSQHGINMSFGTKEGAVVPSTMQKCRDYYAQGKFKPHFVELPFQTYIQSATSKDDQLLLQIYAFMIQHYRSVTEAGPEKPTPPESPHSLSSPVIAETEQTDTVFEPEFGT